MYQCVKEKTQNCKRKEEWCVLGESDRVFVQVRVSRFGSVRVVLLQKWPTVASRTPPGARRAGFAAPTRIRRLEAPEYSREKLSSSRARFPFGKQWKLNTSQIHELVGQCATQVALVKRESSRPPLERRSILLATKSRLAAQARRKSVVSAYTS